MSGEGSSPLARGGPRRPEEGRRKKGLIPARAGRTRRPIGRTGGRWAHPRSRGADLDSGDLGKLPQGSSPLARGGRTSRAE